MARILLTIFFVAALLIFATARSCSSMSLVLSLGILNTKYALCVISPRCSWSMSSCSLRVSFFSRDTGTFLVFCHDAIKNSEDTVTLSVVVDYWNLPLRNVFCQFQNCCMILYLRCLYVSSEQQMMHSHWYFVFTCSFTSGHIQSVFTCHIQSEIIKPEWICKYFGSELMAELQTNIDRVKFIVTKFTNHFNRYVKKCQHYEKLAYFSRDKKIDTVSSLCIYYIRIYIPLLYWG